MRKLYIEHCLKISGIKNISNFKTFQKMALVINSYSTLPYL